MTTKVLLLALLIGIVQEVSSFASPILGAGIGVSAGGFSGIEEVGPLGSGWLAFGNPVYWDSSDLSLAPRPAYSLKIVLFDRLLRVGFELFGSHFIAGLQSAHAEGSAPQPDPMFPYLPFQGDIGADFQLPVAGIFQLMLRTSGEHVQAYVGTGIVAGWGGLQKLVAFDNFGNSISAGYQGKYGLVVGAAASVGMVLINKKSGRDPYLELKFLDVPLNPYDPGQGIPFGDNQHLLNMELRAYILVVGFEFSRKKA